MSKLKSSKKALLNALDKFGIAHKTHEHAPVFTVEESAHIKQSLPGGHTKNLFLKDKAGALFLVCALGDTKVLLNHLHKALGCKRLSFGKPELLQETLGVTPGSVTLFAIINDKDLRVQLVLDKALFTDEIVNFHPLENTATTAIASRDIHTFAAATNHDVVILDLGKV